MDPLVELDEFAILDGLMDDHTGIPFWAGAGFQYPAEGELTSPFGAVRVFNEQFETRHTGWDFNGGQGDLLVAMSNGRVVYSGELPIRGGYVLIDHGYGVYSGYAHLSVRYVVPGQFVRKGELVGLAGSTGRSSAPHLHVEMRINNKWIDPVDFIADWTPQ
jgi:murein DD-endopeptidase MepM/ murein hydrolase activator NlpD